MARAARLEKGLSQAELAERLNMSQRWVSALETNEIKYPRRPVLQRMTFVLGLEYIDLLIAAGDARTRAEAERIASAPDGTDRTLGNRIDDVADELSNGERASIEAIVKTKERERRKAAK
jgi:transcriptional regulator with XRE-family HTH domain